MFKKNLNRVLTTRDPRARTHQYRWPRPCFFLLFIICVAGCQMFPKLPPANLSEPGWTIHQGQAIWQSQKNAPEIAGELLVATNLDGRTFVQFTKTPLPFLAAQSTTNSWQIHSIPDDKTFSGRGKPPARALWLWLPRCLGGGAPPKSITWQRLENDRWRLENHRSGESLEGYLAP